MYLVLHGTRGQTYSCPHARLADKETFLGYCKPDICRRLSPIGTRVGSFVEVKLIFTGKCLNARERYRSEIWFDRSHLLPKATS
jgi:hypothetical protein